MGMQLSDVENDPLVKETVKIFKDAIREEYKDREWGRTSADDVQIGVDDNPVFKLLADADCLDSVSAAALATERLTGWISLDVVAPKLNKEVVEVLKALNGDGGGGMDMDLMDEGPFGMIKSENPSARNMGLAVVVSMCSGEEFQEMLKEADAMEIRMAIGQIGPIFTDLAEQITEKKLWETLPPKLLDQFIGGMEALAGICPSKTQKRVMTESIQELKTEIAKANAIEMIETTPPQINPDSAFIQLKGEAKKFKLG